MAKKSNMPNPVRKGILANKGVAKTKKGNNPSPVRKLSNKKVC